MAGALQSWLSIREYYRPGGAVTKTEWAKAMNQ